MYESISNLINNIFFIIFPIFLYQIFYYERDVRFFGNNKIILTIMFSISITLCILFPFQFLVTKEYIIDMRQVPLIIGTLYGGYGVGAVLFIVSALVRIPLGGDGIYMALLNQFLIFALIPLFQKKYFELIHGKRVLAVSLLAGLSLIFNSVGGALLFNDPLVEVWDAWLILIISQIIFTAFTAIVIERMIKNNFIQHNMIKHEKLDVVSHLSASIAHEIRNPLQVIKGFVQLLKNSEYDRNRQKEFYGYITQEVDSAERIISDYLTFAKPTFEKVSIVSVNKEVEHAVNILQSYANLFSVSIIYNKLEEDSYIECDQEKFKQCLINIARNGIESMEMSGQLSFAVRRLGKSVVIKIKDTGKGMTNEQIVRLGEPYFSSKTKGTGLGMMVVYSIINNMNANLHVKSEVDKGTEFTIEIPLTKAN